MEGKKGENRLGGGGRGEAREEPGTSPSPLYLLSPSPRDF